MVLSKNRHGSSVGRVSHSRRRPVHVRVEARGKRPILKAFNRAVENSGILAQYKEKQAFEKPSDKKRRKKRELRAQARRRMKNQTQRSEMPEEFDSNDEFEAIWDFPRQTMRRR